MWGDFLGSVNLYKIDNEKHQLFLRELERKMENKGTRYVDRETECSGTVQYGLPFISLIQMKLKKYRGTGSYRHLSRRL